jgi:hypothetical protein
LTCSPSAWPSRLLYRRGRNSRRDLWITLYFSTLSHKRHGFGKKRDYWIWNMCLEFLYNFCLKYFYAKNWARYDKKCTGLFKIIVGVLRTCHTQYTWDSNIGIFLFNRTPSFCDIPYMCSICAPFVILQTSTWKSSSFQTVCSMSAVRRSPPS